MKATIVFEKIWHSINAKNPDGSRKYRYIINTGSSRSSKTHSIIQCHYLKAWEKPRRISIWRETKKDTKDTVLADFKKALPSFDKNEFVQFNKTESVYTFPNQSTVEICGGDDESRVHGFQGDIAHFNEPYNISRETFDQIDMRTSEFVIIDWNPKTKHWIDDLSKQDNAIVIHSTFKDNPFCPVEQRNKILSYEPTEYNIANGTANEFMWQVYGLGLKAERPNRIYKDWIKIPAKQWNHITFPSYFGLDFGLSAPCGLVEMKFDGDRTFYLKQHLYKPLNAMAGTLSDEFAKLNISKVKEIICDSGNELNQSEAQKLINAGYNVIKAKKGSGSVVAGIELMQKYKIVVTDDSHELFDEYENYCWRVAKGVQLDEPDSLCADHLLDASKYVINWFGRINYLH